MNAKSLVMVLTATSFLHMGVALARADQCDINSLVALGIMSRGSAICSNNNWHGRPAQLYVISQTRKCDALDEATLAKAIERGVLDFDRQASEAGKIAACDKLDKHMQGIENNLRLHR